MEQDLIKSLVDLIDDTMGEIEQLKKSDRFSAAEIKIEQPGEGIHGQDPNGKIVKDEDEDDEEEKKKKEFAAKDHKHEIDCEVKKEEDEDKDDEDEKKKKEEKMDKEEPKEGYEIKKSEDALMKSMVEARVKPLEDKINSILDLVKSFANAPREQRSVSYDSVAPLKKSESGELLTKSVVCNKLLDLKKSGVNVDSADIAMVELGNDNTLNSIVAKYNIK